MAARTIAGRRRVPAKASRSSRLGECCAAEDVCFISGHGWVRAALLDQFMFPGNFAEFPREQGILGNLLPETGWQLTASSGWEDSNPQGAWRMLEDSSTPSASAEWNCFSVALGTADWGTGGLDCLAHRAKGLLHVRRFSASDHRCRGAPGRIARRSTARQRVPPDHKRGPTARDGATFANRGSSPPAALPFACGF